MNTKTNNTETAAAAPEAPDQIKVKTWIAIRKEAGRKIDPDTAEVTWVWAQHGDPYGINPEPWMADYGIASEYFARCPGSDIWVWFDDLPTATSNALWEKLKKSLAFPAGLPPIEDNPNGVKRAEQLAKRAEQIRNGFIR